MSGMTKTMKERVMLLLSFATAVTASKSYRHTERAEAAGLLQELLNDHGYIFEDDDAPVEVLLSYCEEVIHRSDATVPQQIKAARLMSQAIGSKAYREWSHRKERDETAGREDELRRAAEYEVEGSKPVAEQQRAREAEQRAADPDPSDPPASDPDPDGGA